jgi:HAD superfamily hydrolase (TIGR01662 family)
MSKIVLVGGLPGAGKSSLVQSEQYKDYVRLNRDLIGGSISGLIPLMQKALADGKNVISDNLFCTIEDRKIFIDGAVGHDIEMLWVNTSPEDCQVNACRRMCQKYGHVLAPTEFNDKDIKKDPNTFPPHVFFSWKKKLVLPKESEGFSSVKKVPFIRKWGSEYKNKALILDFDGTLRETVGGNEKYPTNISEQRVLPRRSEILKSWHDKGYLLLGASNQSGIAKGTLTKENAVACFDAVCRELDVEIDYMYDDSKVPPISSWLRKPMPGMGVNFIEKYKLNPSDCIMVGDMKTDNTFADRCGFQYCDSNKFFK